MKNIKTKNTNKTYSATLSVSSKAHVFPKVVIATPAILTKTAVIFAVFTDSWPMSAPKRSVKSPEVEVKTVVLATLVYARAEFDKYCKKLELKNQLQAKLARTETSSPV